MKKLLLSILVMFTLLIIVFGITEEDNNKYNEDSNTLIYSLNTIPSNLQKVSNLTDREEDIICATSRGLVSKDITGNIVMDLIDSYEESDDGIEYIFKLKDDIYWNDGSKITSSDICDFFKELIKVEDKNNIAALLDVYGVQDYIDGKGSFDDIVAITDNENTIKIRLNKVNTNFISELTKPQYKVRKSLPLWSDISSYYNEIVFSGYYYPKVINKDVIELYPNKNYSNSNSKIKIIKDENAEAAMAAFEIGKRDIVVDPPNNLLNDLKKKENLLTFPSDTGMYIIFNETNEDLSLATRGSIYKNLCEALNLYQEENSEMFELAEGTYFRKDKEDLSKVQNRKVIINSAQENLFIKNITICGVDSNVNRDLCKYLAKWFKDNMKITFTYSLISEDDYKNIRYDNKYDLLLVNDIGDSDNREGLFNNFKYFYNKDELEIYNNHMENDNNFNNLEEKLFIDKRILPLLYINKNIAISNSKFKIQVDYNGNIDFNKINNNN